MKLFLPSFKPGIFCMLGKHDNHYTTETTWSSRPSDIPEKYVWTQLVLKFWKEESSLSTEDPSGKQTEVPERPWFRVPCFCQNEVPVSIPAVRPQDPARNAQLWASVQWSPLLTLQFSEAAGAGAVRCLWAPGNPMVGWRGQNPTWLQTHTSVALFTTPVVTRLGSWKWSML